MKPKIAIPQAEIEAFCRRHRICRLAFFGSLLHGDSTPDSDVDVLVEFEPNTHIGLIGFARLENELSEILKRKVDLNTPDSLSPFFATKYCAKQRPFMSKRDDCRGTLNCKQGSRKNPALRRSRSRQAPPIRTVARVHPVARIADGQAHDLPARVP